MVYKVVPGPISVEGDACKLFEDLINKNSVGGWRYHSMETVRQTAKGGCFHKESDVTLYMLIFEKDE